MEKTKFEPYLSSGDLNLYFEEVAKYFGATVVHKFYPGQLIELANFFENFNVILEAAAKLLEEKSCTSES